MGTVHLLLALFAIHYVAAGRALDETDAQSQIINGQDADEGEYPFMVRLAAMNEDGTLEHFCGGSLISSNVVLTAAHCLVVGGMKVQMGMGRVVVGDYTSTEKEDSEQEMVGIRAIVHEDYHLDPTGAPINDVALIILKEKVDLEDGSVSTIAITDTEYDAGSTVTIIGWGAMAGETEGEFTEEAETLQELEYEIADKDDCIQHWDEDIKEKNNNGAIDHDMTMDDIADGMICAIDPAAEATGFSGDSGGPVVAKSGDTFTQIGLVSWGTMDPTERTYNMLTDVHHYKDWIKDNMKRAEEESWIELHTGGSHGVVMVHDKMGHVTTICNDNVGKDEIHAICREQGYYMGSLANVRDYLPAGRRRKNQEDSGVPQFGHTGLSCPSGAENVMETCVMEKYEDSEVPCFDGQQLAVRCADEKWSFKVTHMIPQIRTVKGGVFTRGRVSCVVQAQKYGVYLDMKSQVKVGLVIRGEDGIEEIQSSMKYRKKTNMYVGKFRPADEIKEDECFACIAYLPGTKFYTVGKLGADDCPDDDEYYEKWVEDAGHDEDYEGGDGDDGDGNGDGDGDGGED